MGETASVRPTIFVSYAWADEVSALAIDQWLRNKGARVLIDRRDFIAGNDIENEIVRCIAAAGKVVCIYSASSSDRPYPELERRITAALERQQQSKTGTKSRRLIYFCIDDTPLPPEALPRLAIKASVLDFQSACEELWRSVLGSAAPPREFDLSPFTEASPWAKKSGKRLFDLSTDTDALERFYSKPDQARSDDVSERQNPGDSSNEPARSAL